MPAVFVHEDGTPMNIFISLECPSRSTFVKMVQVRPPPLSSNHADTAKDRRGKIVITEKGADVCIGDHMKRKSPGFVSYHWIEECCKNGQVVDTELHAITVNTPAIRSGGTGGMRTVRRNEFTADEDRMLLEYVKSQAAVNKPISGFAPYNVFAEAVSP